MRSVCIPLHVNFAYLEMYNMHLTICNGEVSDVLKWQLYACNLYNLGHAIFQFVKMANIGMHGIRTFCTMPFS